MTRILLGGGTGLVGGLLTQRLLAREDVALTSLVRRGVAAHERVTDFDALIADPAGTAAAMGLGPVDVGISCLGTTIRIAKSQAAFRRVDFDMVIALAKAAKALGARQFIVVTSVGAKQGSGNFYLSVKGDTEAALGAMRFERLDILRPGLILGPRAERRPAEDWAQRVAAWLNPVVKLLAPDYAAVRAQDVAGAILSAALESASGTGILRNRQIEHLGDNAFPPRSVIERVAFFKRDLLTTDLICCTVLTSNATYEWDEEQGRWQALLDHLGALPGFDQQWFAKVSQPPFAPSEVIAFQRQAIPAN